MALHQVLSISLNFYIKHVEDDFPCSHKFPSSPFLIKSNFYYIVIISDIVWLPNKDVELWKEVTLETRVGVFCSPVPSGKVVQ